MSKLNRLISLILILIFCLNLCACSSSSETDLPSLDELIAETATYVYSSIETPQTASVYGDWAVIGLYKSSIYEDTFFDEYYSNICEYLSSVDGILSTTKSTEYSRLAIALSNLGYDCSDIATYDLISPLLDYDFVTLQGLNAVIYALIALNSANITDEICDEYQAYILDRQLADGGWSLMTNATTSDIDITAMALQALSFYVNSYDVSNSIDKAISYLSSSQNEDASFSSFEAPSLETTTQVLVALCKLNISIDDESFVKNGLTIYNSIDDFRLNDGSYSSTIGGEVSQIATEQALLALTEIYNFQNQAFTCSLTISCSTIFDNIDDFNSDKISILPDGGLIYENSEIIFNEGDSVFDVLLSAMTAEKIHMEYVATAGTNSVYIEGIANIYEFDCGSLSGWIYAVNGVSYNYSCSEYFLQNGDEIQFLFTCSLGSDLPLTSVS